LLTKALEERASSGIASQIESSLISSGLVGIITYAISEATVRGSLYYLANSITPPPAVLPKVFYPINLLITSSNWKLLESYVVYLSYLAFFYAGRYFSDALYNNQNPYIFAKIIFKNNFDWSVGKILDAFYANTTNITLSLRILTKPRH
jgi:hypothetical protein